MVEVKFKNYDCIVKKSIYFKTKNIALRLFDKAFGEPVATATVDLGIKLPLNTAYIKDYSENEGMLEALKNAGIVKSVISWDLSGYVLIPHCKLDSEMIAKMDKFY